MSDNARTENAWERRKSTAGLTDKTPVEKRVPIWKKEKSVLHDIENVAPSALRTGGELAASPWTATEWIPALTQWVIENSPFISDQEKQEALASFKSAHSQVEEAPAPLKAIGVEKNPMTALNIQNTRDYVTNPLLGPADPKQAETLPGKITQRTLEIAPSVFLGPGGMAQKAVTSIGSGAGGPVAAALAERGGFGKSWQTAADIGGSLLGGVSPMVYNRLVNPNPIPASRQPAVDIMRTRNVPLSVGQQSGNERLLRRELNAGGPEAWDQQPGAFTRATAEEQGGFPRGTDQLSNATMRTELRRMGAEFDRIEAAANPTPFDMAAQNRLLQITTDYQRNNPLVAPIVEDIMNDLAANAGQNGGFLTGQGFHSARSKIGDLIRKTDDDGVRGALMDFQDTLDGLLQNSLSPEDQHAFRTVRAQYRNYLPIEFAKSGQGQGAREGFLSPQSLMTGIRNVEGRREVASGNRPMTELAEAGGTTMVKPNTTGTAENLRAQLAGLIPILGAGAGATLSKLPGLADMLPKEIGGFLPLAAGTLGGAAAYAFPKIRDAYTRSGLGQTIAGRNLGPRIDTNRADLSAMIAAAMAAAARQQGDYGRR